MVLSLVLLVVASASPLERMLVERLAELLYEERDIPRGRGLPEPITNQIANDTLSLAYSSFCAEEDVMSWSCAWCNQPNIEPVTYLAATGITEGTQGYIAVDHDNKNIVIAFRGSKSIANWIQDAQFWMTSYGHGPADDRGNPTKVLSGFLTAYNTLKDDLMTGINEGLQKCPDCELLWTGHSLGGAMATVGSITYLATQGTGRASNLFTFGCPRVGNQAFVNYALDLMSQSGSFNYRVARENDIVPGLPPSSMAYRHLPQEFWDKQDGSFVACSTTDGEDDSCYNSGWNLSPIEHMKYLGMYAHGMPCF